MPYPPDYGGVFDLFYKMKTLSELGIKIQLHCFDYGRGEQAGLNKYCESVTYYARTKSLTQLLSGIPYMVSSRANRTLLQNLLQDENPILLEGIHCTYFLYNDELKNKKVFLRLHNVEFKYYQHLAKNEKSFLKKLFFLNESRLLRGFEKSIIAKAPSISVSQNDIRTYQQNFGADLIKYLPVFLPYNSIESKVGNGKYCLYHGNLSVNENENAAIWLSEKVFSNLHIPFIIAGKNPSKKLKKIAEKNKNISVIVNPDEERIAALIGDAHINIVPSFNITGIKIKLLNALFNGRHCITNNAAVDGTQLKSLVYLSNNPTDFISLIQELMNKEFLHEEIVKRENVLLTEFNNTANAMQLIQWIY